MSDVVVSFLVIGGVCFVALFCYGMYIDIQQKIVITEKIKEMKGDKLTIADLAVYKKIFLDKKEES